MATLSSDQAPAATMDGIKTSLQDHITTLTPFKKNLTEEQKRGNRTMAEGREGYARMVSQIGTSNIGCLGRDQDPVLLTVKLAYDMKLEESRQALMTLTEIVTETQLANSVDIMKMVDDFVKVLQVSRNNNGSLDLAMREVDDWNNRFGTRPNAEPITPTV